MTLRAIQLLPSLLLLLAAACSPQPIDLASTPTESAAGLAARGSPYDSTRVPLGTEEARICYSRPSAKGRVVFGGLVPFDTLWRTGANEPTIIHLPVAAAIAGLPVTAGHYALYTVPSQGAWTLVVNASTSQWGLTADAVFPDGTVIPNSYTDEVRAREVGRVPVMVDSIAPVEQFTIRAEPAGSGAVVRLEWATTRVSIPITPTPAAAP